MISLLRIFSILICIKSTFGAHFRGGVISWRPASNEPSVIGSTRTIIIDQRYAWSRSVAASSCTAATILTFGLIGESAISLLTCESAAATCNSVQYTSSSQLSTYTTCTDFNTALGMSFGQSSKTVNLTVTAGGFLVGYVVSAAWLSLQLGGGGWSMMMYINMQPRADNGLINSSPTSNIQPVVYVPAGVNITAIVDIPMADDDGDIIQCRFAKSSSVLAGKTVNECSDVCATAALPASRQLISGNNTCTLIVQLTSIGYYAVAIQIEDFVENSTTPLSSIPVQFLLLSYDASNPTTNCQTKPIITSIPPDYPLVDGTVTVQVTVNYTAMVIAQTGCAGDTETTIINFITSSPPGMVKTAAPFPVSSPQYAINLTWAPTMDQLGKTYRFCATAIDSNYYYSDQYCFDLIVGPKTTTTTTTSTTSTTSTSTTSTTSSTSTTSTSTTTTSATTTTTTTTSEIYFQFIQLRR